MSLSTALAFTLPTEGGYSNKAADHGGPTDEGVTQATYDNYLAKHGLPSRPVSGITAPEVQDIYSSLYWLPAHCAELPIRLGICHFDWAVNHGVEGAIKTLQEALSVTADGIFGSLTRAAIQGQPEAEIVAEYLKLRREWYEADAKENPDQAEFLTGWLNRVDRLEKYLATVMA